MDDVVYFSINNWFSGRDYPIGDEFEALVKFPSPLQNDEWCKDNKLCVLYGPIDMSTNYCVTAPKHWVEKHLPKLLSNESYKYYLIQYYKGKETRMDYEKNYSDFLYHRNDDELSVYDKYDWPFEDYSEENFGSHYYDYDEYADENS